MSMEHHEGGHQPGQVDPHLPSFVQVVPPQPVQFSQPVPVPVVDQGYNRGQVSTYNFSNVVERRNAPIPPPVALFTGSSSSAQYTLNSVLAEDSGPKHSLWQRYLRVVSVDNQARKLSIFIGFMAVVFIFKLHISYGAESMALLASAYYTLFTLLALATSLVALVANKQRSTLAFSYGYDRYELLMGFASGTLLVFVSLYVLFEGFEHILEPHEVNTNKLMLTSLFGMVAHVLAVLLFNDQIKLRTELATHSRMKSVEGLVRQLVTDVMPDLLLFVTSLIFYVQPIYWLESLIGWVIALHAMWTVIPYCVESGRILIQSVPQSIQYILEDTIRDATTVDGVLEVRRKKSHFWTFAPGVFVGTLHVRVKQDADVQQVLQQLTKLFSPIIQHLSIQVQKDDWGHGHQHDKPAHDH